VGQLRVKPRHTDSKMQRPLTSKVSVQLCSVRGIVGCSRDAIFDNRSGKDIDVNAEMQ
jgi:hypothetical protein